MQNEPNFKNTKMNINRYPGKDYENLRLSGNLKNKPNQTQFRQGFWAFNASEDGGWK